MLIRVSQVNLYDALQNVIRAISPHTLIPVLSGIKLIAHSNGLTLFSSNTSLMIQYEIPLVEGYIEIVRTGSIVVPAKYFLEIIRKFPSESVTLELTEHLVLTIRSDFSVYRLCGMDPIEFPRIPEVKPNIIFSIQSSLLHRVIRQVVFAASTSENRPILTGVSCQLAVNDRLRFLATDGVRLASRTIDTDLNSVHYFPPIVIPSKNFNELSKLLNDEQETAEIIFGENRAILKTRNLICYSALIDGTYPSIDNIISVSHTTEIIVDTASMINTLERVSLLADESNVLRLNATEHHIELVARTAEIGDVHEEMSIELITGAEIQISFNGKHLRDILRSIDTTKTTLKFSGKLNPIIIEPYDDSQSIYLLTPIRSA
ncbi:DNA polymerase III subunit beta [Cohnella suwonensis]|uniref:Beta sliding clamp n=1 Tax=Cohnella suwonensis TaxID=696072 RepID=A0ABW0LYV7_9BACL